MENCGRGTRRSKASVAHFGPEAPLYPMIAEMKLSLLLIQLYNRGILEMDTAPNEIRKTELNQVWTVA